MCFAWKCDVTTHQSIHTFRNWRNILLAKAAAPEIDSGAERPETADRDPALFPTNANRANFVKV